MSDALSAIAGGQLYISVNDSGDGSAEYITPGDMEAIKEKVPHVKGVTPSDSMMGTLLSPKGSFDVIASTGTADLEYTHNPEMKYGHYFTDSDVEAMNLVAVIGQRDAIKMFGTDDVVGNERGGDDLQRHPRYHHLRRDPGGAVGQRYDGRYDVWHDLCQYVYALYGKLRLRLRAG